MTLRYRAQSFAVTVAVNNVPQPPFIFSVQPGDSVEAKLARLLAPGEQVLSVVRES